MFKRAQELDKNGQADQAIAMLKKVVKVYKETPAARRCRRGTASLGKKPAGLRHRPDRGRRTRQGNSGTRRTPTQCRCRGKAQRTSGHQGSGCARVAAKHRRGGRRSTVGANAAKSDRGRPGRRTAPASRVSGQSSGRNSRVGLANGDRERPRRSPDGSRSRRHVHHGQQRRPARRKTSPPGSPVNLLHRPARSDRTASSARSSTKRTITASPPENG